eukprot:scaffold2534_cov260-Pinguiococcus_pyrenoidosus.AAC.2
MTTGCAMGGKKHGALQEEQRSPRLVSFSIHPSRDASAAILRLNGDLWASSADGKGSKGQLGPGSAFRNRHLGPKMPLTSFWVSHEDPEGDKDKGRFQRCQDAGMRL